MTPAARLRAIRERLAKRTTGPWKQGEVVDDLGSPYEGLAETDYRGYVECDEYTIVRPGIRNDVRDCAHHAACLEHAVAQSWDAFSCANCQHHEPVKDRAENYGRHESPAAQMERACPNVSGVDGHRMTRQIVRRFKALGWDKHQIKNRKQGGGIP